jgi:hypothetical protein
MTCSSCLRPAACLLVLTSQRGEYQLCCVCLGRDAEAKGARVPTSIPQRSAKR